MLTSDLTLWFLHNSATSCKRGKVAPPFFFFFFKLIQKLAQHYFGLGAGVAGGLGTEGWECLKRHS